MKAAQQRVVGFILQATEEDSISGHGVIATWDGHDIAVGTPALMVCQGINVTDHARDHPDRLQHEGKTTMLIGVDVAALCLVAVQDPPP